METVGDKIVRILEAVEYRLDDMAQRLLVLESQSMLHLESPRYNTFSDGTSFDWELGMLPDIDTEHMNAVAFKAGTVVYVDYDRLDTRKTCTVRAFVTQVHALIGVRKNSGSYYAGMIDSDGHLCMTFAKV